MDAPGSSPPLGSSLVLAPQEARPMFESRDLKQDLLALALAALVVFFALALGTYNAADPLGEMLWPVHTVYQPNPQVYPLGEHVTNVCGRLGAVTADIGYST